MRLIKLFLILAVSVSLVGCIKRTVKKDNSNTNSTESIDGPRVIRDTIVKEIIIEKEIEPQGDIVQQQEPEQVKTPTPTHKVTSSTTKPRYEDKSDHYDRGNSGFFDQYQQSYDGDPNRNLKPTTRIVDDGAEDVSRKKEMIEKSLDALEKKNRDQKEEYERYERERQAANARAIQEAKEANKAQQQKKQNQSNSGKTLDTDLLLKNKR